MNRHPSHILLAVLMPAHADTLRHTLENAGAGNSPGNETFPECGRAIKHRAGRTRPPILTLDGQYTVCYSAICCSVSQPPIPGWARS